jgi:hypothetical protein
MTNTMKITLKTLTPLLTKLKGYESGSRYEEKLCSKYKI